VLWKIEKLICVSISSVANCSIDDCVRVALRHRERARSSEIGSEVTHLRERLSERSNIPDIYAIVTAVLDATEWT